MDQITYAVDNSAILYLALMRKRHTNVYRFTMTLKHMVDPVLLQQAVDRTYKRFPTIIAGFRPDFFQYTLIPAAAAPVVQPDPGCLVTMTPEEIRTCAYRIYYSGRDYQTTKGYSEKFAGTIDEEVKELIGKAYAHCEQILRDNSEKLQEVVTFLLENETMTGAQFTACMEGRPVGEASETAMLDRTESEE